MRNIITSGLLVGLSLTGSGCGWAAVLLPDTIPFEILEFVAPDTIPDSQKIVPFKVRFTFHQPENCRRSGNEELIVRNYEAGHRIVVSYVLVKPPVAFYGRCVRDPDYPGFDELTASFERFSANEITITTPDGKVSKKIKVIEDPGSIQEPQEGP